jgi:hypothetical protein
VRRSPLTHTHTIYIPQADDGEEVGGEHDEGMNIHNIYTLYIHYIYKNTLYIYIYIPQADDGEEVGGEHDEGILGHAEDGRDRVHREHDVADIL